mgnify:FL=1
MPTCIVTARLLSPVAAYHPLHLDGLLAAVAHGASHHLCRSSPATDIAIPPIPIYHLDVLGSGCYLSSAWLWPEGAARGRERFTKKKDAADIELRDRVWNHKSGPEKAYDVAIPTIESQTVSWVAVGSRRGLIEALRYVRQIGMMRRHGYGMVGDWDVSLAPEQDPIQTLIDTSGRAARHLPATWANGETERGAYEPPYWHPARAADVRVPIGTLCQLRPEVMAAVRGVR